MNQRKFFRYLGLAVASLGIAIFFNNCGKGRSADSATLGLPSANVSTYNAADICNEEDITVFSRGYHPFLAQNCTNCHINGPGKGTFASPTLETAFAGFSQIGYDKISQYAVNNSHNPPYTGSHNLEIINSFRLQWQTYQKEKLKCGDGTSEPVVENQEFVPEFETDAKPIPQIIGTTTTTRVNGADVLVTTFPRRVLTWNLNTALTSLNGKEIPNLVGAELSVTVTGFQVPSGETAYVVSLPMLKVGSNSLHFRGMNLKLNGFPIRYATTFKNMDTNAYQNTTQLLSPGSLVSVGPLGAQDTLALQFGDIEIVNLPAPPPPPSVQFSVASMTIQPSQLGYANKVTIQVQVTGDNVDPISVPVNVADEDDYAAGEVPATGVLGIGQNRFDWDYRFDANTSTSLNFNANQKTASFSIIFSDDLRNDVNKVLRLSLGTPLGARIGGNSEIRISLPDYNSPASGNAPTFAQLMNPRSGILGVSCVKCHNSVQRQGGYDMTDYQDMKNRGIIVPGNTDRNQHKMFRRMNADAPNLEGLQSMPLDGFLPRDQVDLVNQWILDGAKNN